jgi:exopolysaccharide production protein ExoQ
LSETGLTAAPGAPAWALPHDRSRMWDAILRATIIVNVIGASSNFHPDLLPTALSWIQQYVGIACWIVTIVAARAARPAPTIALGSDAWALIVFYGYAIISVLWTDMTPASTMKAVALAISTFGAYTLATRWRLQSLIDDINTGLLVLTIASIVVVITMPHIGIASGWLQVGNWQGVFESKQALGVLGGMAMFFAGYLWLTRGPSWLYALSFACAATCAIGSESRGGGALALLSCAFVFLAGRSRNIAKVLSFAPLLIMIIATLMIAYLYATGEDAFPIGDTRVDFTERTFIWQHALARIDQRPLFGYGLSGFWTIGDIYVAFERQHGWILDNYHSGFVAILTELGVVGYALFTVCTLLFGVRMATAIDRGEMERSRIVALIGFMTLAYQIDVTEWMFLKSTSFVAVLILVFAFNATLRSTDAGAR